MQHFCDDSASRMGRLTMRRPSELSGHKKLVFSASVTMHIYSVTMHIYMNMLNLQRAEARKSQVLYVFYTHVRIFLQEARQIRETHRSHHTTCCVPRCVISPIIAIYLSTSLWSEFGPHGDHDRRVSLYTKHILSLAGNPASEPYMDSNFVTLSRHG